jgi:hypothetical protein
MFFHMAEYCDTPQSKERRNRENKACLNERTILRLLDHEFSKNSDVLWFGGIHLTNPF